MCTHVDLENIPTQQITTVMTTVRAASTSSPHDCVSTHCVHRVPQASSKVKSKRPASPAVLEQHAPVQQPQQQKQQKQARTIHHFKPQGPHHSYPPGSTGAAQTMAWLATEYAGVIGENFENPIGLELCCHHGTCPPGLKPAHWL